MPHRYFTDKIAGETARLTDADAHHLATVMRARPGQEVLLCDGHGTDYDALVESVSAEEVLLRITGHRPCAAESPLRVTLFVGYPKQDKLEWILQKAVELGAVEIVPFFSRWCVAAPKKEEQKNERYTRLVRAAAGQCGRGILPTVSLPLTVREVAERLPDFEASLLLYEKGGAALRSLPLPTAGRLALITGAEGGFAPEEADQLRAAGAQWVGLGPRILRCETAPLAALAAVMALTGNLE